MCIAQVASGLCAGQQIVALGWMCEAAMGKHKFPKMIKKKRKIGVRDEREPTLLDLQEIEACSIGRRANILITGKD